MTGAGDGLADRLLSRCTFPARPCGQVFLAVSGGPDSMALVILAARAGLDGTVMHVDHGLREGSFSEAGLVEAAARRFGFSFSSLSVAVEPGPDLEARARRARYGVLPARVLTGHTMDDQAETVLLNVIRGAALDGLTGMRSGAGGSGWGAGRSGSGSGRAVPVRPLIGLRRAETREVCEAYGVEVFTDPTNHDGRFRRNRIRSEVLPLLCDVAERDVVPILARQADLLAADRDYLEEAAGTLDPTDVRSLRMAPPALASRAIREWLRRSDFADLEAHPPSGAELRRVLEVVGGSVRACELSGGVRVERTGGRLRIVGPAGTGAAGAVAEVDSPHGRSPTGVSTQSL